MANYVIEIWHVKANLPQKCLHLVRLAVTFVHMGSKIAAKRRYGNQRERRTPPHISLQAYRLAMKRINPEGRWDLDDICDRVEEQNGDRPARGTVSAIENGVRGVSVELLTALEAAYRLPAGAITTDYTPRTTPAASDVA